MIDPVLRSALDGVIDPELGVFITDLGLVYTAVLSGGVAEVTMTTTTPICPLGAYLTREVERVLIGLPQISEVLVRLVDEPQWTPALISDHARRLLGLTG